MVFADLPYGTTRNPWDSLVDLDRLWPELLRVTTVNAPIVMTAQMPFTAVLTMSNLPLFRHHWVWEKTNATGHLNAKRAPMKAHEDILVFCRKQPRYNPQKTSGHVRKVSAASSKNVALNTPSWGTFGATSYDSTERYPRTVQVFSSDKQTKALHPTQKPVALLEYLIRTYSDEGQLVLDPTAGSATTGVAAWNTGRRSLLMERDPEIARKAGLRLNELVLAAA
jgi:hypothetical protein